jgi:hypothetical protein
MSSSVKPHKIALLAPTPAIRKRSASEVAELRRRFCIKTKTPTTLMRDVRTASVPTRTLGEPVKFSEVINDCDDPLAPDETDDDCLARAAQQLAELSVGSGESYDGDTDE